MNFPLRETGAEVGVKQLGVVEAAEHSPSLTDINTMIKVSGAAQRARAHEHTTKPELKVVLRAGCTHTQNRVYINQ